LRCLEPATRVGDSLIASHGSEELVIVRDMVSSVETTVHRTSVLARGKREPSQQTETGWANRPRKCVMRDGRGGRGSIGLTGTGARLQWVVTHRGFTERPRCGDD
jgi:hypothetical protein